LLQAALDRLVADGVPGVIAFQRQGSRAYRATSGVRELATGKPIRADDRFRIGSITKSFVSTVILQLVGEHRLRLSDTVERWLPNTLPSGSSITVRQLLNHTSGLYDPQVEVYQTLQDLYDRRLEHWTPRQVVALSVAHGLLFPPGTAWSYSNTNYVVAGLLIERVTGTSIARQLERRLIRPWACATPGSRRARPPCPRRACTATCPWTISHPWPTPTSPGSTRRSSGPRGRWCPTSTTWTGSTTPCSTAACCPSGCWPRC
jgi:CubicO group peptidase (beta-lactamase class C family)